MADMTSNTHNKSSLLKDKFATLIAQGQGLASPEGNQGSLNELKKYDLFDLGIVLTLAATDGLDMLNEEYVEKLCNFKD